MEYQGLTGAVYQVEENRLAGGGEGDIYEIVGMDGYVAKIFKPDKRNAEREEKLRYMVKKAVTAKDLQHITWPLDVVYNIDGFAGYIMQKVKQVQPLTAVYSGQQYDLRYRLLAAYNLCAAIETVHSMGQVCGDLNPQNICINLNTQDKSNAFQVTLVDADSYHFITPEKTYRCEVGLADYLAPEIQKKVSGSVTLRNAPLPTFTKETDLFALAVHVFCLLMNGCHPFACAKEINGTMTNTMDPMTASSQKESIVAPQPIENIKEGYFPFYDHRTNVTIPLYAPPFRSLPEEIQKLFIRTFKDGYTDPSKRVSAEEWCRVLKTLVGHVKECTQKHYYFDHTSTCPFCTIEDNIRSVVTGRDDIESSEIGTVAGDELHEDEERKAELHAANEKLKAVTILVVIVFMLLLLFLFVMQPV